MATATVAAAMPEVPAVRSRPLDTESREWLASLRSRGAEQAAAIERLHDLLLRAARFEVARRRPGLPHLRGNELDDIAQEAADDALMSVLGRLAWQGREVPLEPESWGIFASSSATPEAEAQQGELLRAVKEAIAEALTPRQREVLVALALNGVPIDVLAERMGSTRGALYKTLHDARAKLRARLGDLLEVIE